MVQIVYETNSQRYKRSLGRMVHGTNGLHVVRIVNGTNSLVIVGTDGATTLSHMNLSGYVGHVTIFSSMFTIACCL